MSDRRLLVLAAAVALIAIGVFALQFPVYLTEFDRWGAQIRCGNGFGAELLQASIADDGSTSFTDGCRTALAVRRGWAIPTIVFGWAVLSWAVFPWLKPKRTDTD
jgi:hypothetical protein